MSPISTATREQGGERKVAAQPYPSLELLRELAKEIVVDWQLPSDMEPKR